MKNFMIITSLLALLFQGCKQKEAPVTNTKLGPEQAEAMQATIIEWMECEECTEGQLTSVIRQGEAAVPTLAAILMEGPSPAKIQTVEDHLRTTYQNLLEYAKTHPENKPEMNEEEYVKQYLNNYRALYQSRAATALGEIGGEKAREALEKAAGEKLRDDVLTAVKNSLSKIK